MAADSNALPDQCAFATSLNLNLTKCTCALLNGNSLLTSSLLGGLRGFCHSVEINVKGLSESGGGGG